MFIFFKLLPISGHLSITDNFFKTRRCPQFRGFTVLVAYEHLLAILILLLFFSDMPVMLTLVLTENMHDKARIFLCTCCGSFCIHQPMAVHHFAYIDHDNLLGSSFSKTESFIESLPAIHKLTHLNIFPKKYVNTSVTQFVGVLKSFR